MIEEPQIFTTQDKIRELRGLIKHEALLATGLRNDAMSSEGAEKIELENNARILEEGIRQKEVKILALEGKN